MVGFFPPGFWKAVVMVGMVLFFVLGLDLLLGSRLIIFLSQTFNRKFHVDQVVVQALSDLKKTSDKEFDVDPALIRGWGRFILGGLLFFCVILMWMVLMPRLK